MFCVAYLSLNRRAYDRHRARSIRKRIKAFSAPIYVLKAVMAGQVGRCMEFEIVIIYYYLKPMKFVGEEREPSTQSKYRLSCYSLLQVQTC